MGGRGAGSGGGGRVIGFSAKFENGSQMRVYSMPGSKTQVRVESRTGTSIRRVNGGINAMMKNAKNNGVQIKRITAKSEKQYQQANEKARKEVQSQLKFNVNGGEARRYRLQRRVMERGRPEARNH